MFAKAKRINAAAVTTTTNDAAVVVTLPVSFYVVLTR
jgi:hypothetical protein